MEYWRRSSGSPSFQEIADELGISHARAFALFHKLVMQGYCYHESRKHRALRVSVIVPYDRTKYPAEWEKIARKIKDDADWTCRECGKLCRRPGETFDTHRRTLTVAHLNHTPMDVSEGNLRALCAPCHLRYDAPMKAAKRQAKKKE